MLANASGTLLPNATNVKPIIESGISMVNPIVVTIHTSVYVKNPIQLIAMMKVNKTNPRHRGRRKSGIVKKNVNFIGKVNTHPIFLTIESG